MTKGDTRAARKREHVRTEILDAARDVILRDGMARFAVSSVANELGLTKPAVYYYFRSREALIQEFLLREWFEAASAVENAVEQTQSGANAIEAMMRTIFARYRDQLDLFMFCYRGLPANEFGSVIGAEELERVRPVNDMLYGGAEARLCQDQDAGIFPRDRSPRRFAFTAHTAVVGLLNMLAMVATASDPLIHSDDDLIDDLCQTFRDAARTQRT